MHRMILAPGFGRFSACTGHGLPGFGCGPIAGLFTASHFDKVSCKREIESSSRGNSIILRFRQWGVRQLALNLIRISVILNQQIMWVGAEEVVS